MPIQIRRRPEHHHCKAIAPHFAAQSARRFDLDAPSGTERHRTPQSSAALGAAHRAFRKWRGRFAAIGKGLAKSAE
jgi:hypothetical protein